MTTIASISMSVDGFVTGPDDRPGQGLGVGGERLLHAQEARRQFFLQLGAVLAVVVSAFVVPLLIG